MMDALINILNSEDREAVVSDSELIAERLIGGIPHELRRGLDGEEFVLERFPSGARVFSRFGSFNSFCREREEHIARAVAREKGWR